MATPLEKSFCFLQSIVKVQRPFQRKNRSRKWSCIYGKEKALIRWKCWAYPRSFRTESYEVDKTVLSVKLQLRKERYGVCTGKLLHAVHRGDQNRKKTTVTAVETSPFTEMTWGKTGEAFLNSIHRERIRSLRRLKFWSAILLGLKFINN